ARHGREDLLCDILRRRHIPAHPAQGRIIYEVHVSFNKGGKRRIRAGRNIAAEQLCIIDHGHTLIPRTRNTEQEFTPSLGKRWSQDHPSSPTPCNPCTLWSIPSAGQLCGPPPKLCVGP